MEAIDKTRVQELLDELAGTPLYIHLETTNGAYASHVNESFFSAGAFIRNVKLTFLHGKIAGAGPYRIGFETELGWLYGEGLTDFEVDKEGRYLFAGHDADGRLAIALELSREPFTK
ncbi:YojF family protein [Paenalkalicoccus suaedae]|uniref:YojF family protein n=1 Tax=Paenalkalicoccus suaedae TaxID=2592382 RepID=A0A859FIV2_9BACI|nr:YojF family protein [Paenalkalicoccus suaedae]QKS72870.1 YojF family protein [Paenalkalicoccus suaedae]